jgi:hypothetical protein
MQNFAHEFVELVVPEAGIGVPMSLEDTAALLDKPSQVLAIGQIWETAEMQPRKLIEAFIKNEPCLKPGRIISSFADMRFLLQFSSFSLTFRNEVLHAEHNSHWFCPGSTPAEIATKVAEYCRSVEEPLEGDYSNFDGTVSAWAQRFVMNAVYHRYFNAVYRKQLTGFTDMLINCPARAKRFGFRYEAGVGVKSGSPTTCDLNTVLNAYIQYCAVRIAHPDQAPADAFKQIGLAFGDDSLFDQQYRKQYARVATSLGMDLKVEKCNPEMGVTFLARVFPDPWTTLTSFQDPLRTWRKLHITARNKTIPVADAAVDRVSGYLVSDWLSPVTSHYCKMVRRYYTEVAPEAIRAAPRGKREQRKSHGAEKPYWLTAGGAWPQEAEDVDLMERVTAARTGVDLETLRLLQVQLSDCKDPWSPFTLNRTAEPNPYKATLDEDGGPVEGLVDNRKYQHERKIVLLRGGLPVPEGIGNPSEKRPTSSPRTKHPLPGGKKGSGCVLHVSGKNAQSSPSRNGKPARKTSPSGVLARGGSPTTQTGRGRANSRAPTTTGAARGRRPSPGEGGRDVTGRPKAGGSGSSNGDAKIGTANRPVQNLQVEVKRCK